MLSVVLLAKDAFRMYGEYGCRSRNRRLGMFAHVVTDVERRIVGPQAGHRSIRRLPFRLLEWECTLIPTRSGLQACMSGTGQVCPEGP